MRLQPGQRVGSYEVLAPIGAGGMGEVFRGRDTKLDREARALTALNHPNVAQIYAAEAHGSTSALIMELVAGQTLAQLAAVGPVATDSVLDCAAQMAAALDAAHEMHVVHRDFKPGNVMVTPDGRVKVLDNRIVVADHTASGDAFTSGRPRQSSPVQLANRGVNRTFDLHRTGDESAPCFRGKPPALASRCSSTSSMS